MIQHLNAPRNWLFEQFRPFQAGFLSVYPYPGHAGDLQNGIKGIK
jgi:hypothetical protein